MPWKTLNTLKIQKNYKEMTNFSVFGRYNSEFLCLWGIKLNYNAELQKLRVGNKFK